MIASSRRGAVLVLLAIGLVVGAAVTAALIGLPLPSILVAVVVLSGMVFAVIASVSEYRAARAEGMKRGSACRRAFRDFIRVSP